MSLPRLSPLMLAFFATPLCAQSLPKADPVIVTASRQSEPHSQALATVSVIDRDEIEASGSVDVVELLRRVPGLDVVRAAGLGQQTSVFIRGTNSNHSLVLVDGIRVSAMGTGAYAWAELPVDQIERIEIVRGPRASLWGADALGGVIQIFTRRDGETQTTLRAGNHGTYGVGVGTGVEGKNTRATVYVNWLDSRGTNATRPNNWGFNPDRDGVVMRSLSMTGDMSLGAQELEGTLLHSDNESEFDQGISMTEQTVIGLATEGQLGKGWQHRLNLGVQEESLQTTESFTGYRSRRNQADWQHHLEWRDWQSLTLGLAWLEERGRQLDIWSPMPVYSQSRQTYSGFAMWRAQLQQHEVALSGRYDDNSVYGGESSFSANWAWQVAASLRLHADWGEGFRAPSMNELYSPGYDGWYAGNPHLNAEHSESWELGMRWDYLLNQRMGLRVFRNDIGNLIDFVGPQAQALNHAKARIEGVEAEWTWQTRKYLLQANATWQDAHSVETGEALLRRAPRKANLLIERSLESGLRLGVEGVAVSDRPDYGVQLPGYGLLSLRAQLPLRDGWRLDGRIENLLDRDYTLIDAYNSPGMTFLIGLRWAAFP